MWLDFLQRFSSYGAGELTELTNERNDGRLFTRMAVSAPWGCLFPGGDILDQIPDFLTGQNRSKSFGHSAQSLFAGFDVRFFDF